MAGRPVSANADGDAAFGPLGTGQPPEWSVTGRPAQEGDEDRSTWLTGRFELGRNDTRAVLRRTLMSSSADRGHRRERPGAPRRLARPRHQGDVSVPVAAPRPNARCTQTELPMRPGHGAVPVSRAEASRAHPQDSATPLPPWP
jgi:hypothetical protein